MQIDRLFITPQTSLIETMKKMDEVGRKILFLVEGRKLLGCITDGDIRKYILRTGVLCGVCEDFANMTPYTIPAISFEESLATQELISRKIDCVPLVDSSGNVTDVFFLNDHHLAKRGEYDLQDHPIVIMAGGEGKRLAPYTKVIPKPLMPINDRPIVQHIIDRFCQYGGQRFILSLNYKAAFVEAFFADIKEDYRIEFVHEKKPLGTAGSLTLLQNIDKTFFLSNCDILVEADYGDILRHHQAAKAALTIVGAVKHFSIPYGIMEIEKNGNFIKMQEKPNFDFLINTGFYVIEPEVISFLAADKALNMDELIELLREEGAKVCVYPVSEKAWLDMGETKELKRMLATLSSQE